MERCKIWENKNPSAGLQSVLVLLDRSWQVRTWLKDEFWSNLARFGSRNGILMKFIDDAALFLLEKPKKHMFFYVTHFYHRFWPPDNVFYCFNVFFRFLAEIRFRTIIKLPQKASSRLKKYNFGTIDLV